MEPCAGPLPSRELTSASSSTKRDHYATAVTPTTDSFVDLSTSHSATGVAAARLSGNGSGILEADPGVFATTGRFEPSDLEEEELGWGVVRLYRDTEETPGLYEDVAAATKNKSKNKSKSRNNKSKGLGPRPGEGSGASSNTDTTNERGGGAEAKEYEEHDVGATFKDEDCTTLCILAVPSYLTPSDFLGFVGQRAREEVSHFRMVRTERSNRYMVLMKFRSGRTAREWRKEWNGKAWNNVESEHCHVVFVKSIKFRIKADPDDSGDSFPDMTNDPFTPASKAETKLPTTSLNSKPMAPPTPALIEMPTCPVCLERMDESTGLLTILCQHVFHCSCLQKWRGSGCPVCRYTQGSSANSNHLPSSTFMDSNGAVAFALNECSTCHSDVNLWICLICGTVGCGRYDAAHAFLHYKQSTHAFAMDLTTQRIWDYDSDGYVHRIMQSKIDGKLVELPAAITTATGSTDHTDGDDAHNRCEDEVVPREKFDALAREYTVLLTSQLDSQRLYFSEKLEAAADKASRAAASAASAAERADLASATLASLQAEHERMVDGVVLGLERERGRVERKAERFEGMARKLEREWREEKALSKSLMERIDFLGGEAGRLGAENTELREGMRDLQIFISGGEKLKAMEAGGQVEEGEFEGGTVSLADLGIEEKEKEKEKEKLGGGGKGKGQAARKAKAKARAMITLKGSMKTATTPSLTQRGFGSGEEGGNVDGAGGIALASSTAEAASTFMKNDVYQNEQ